MKKFIISSLSFLLLTSTSKAYEALVAPPRVEYPTELIGNFMGFCITTMNARASIDPMNQYVPKEILQQTHSRVCACIMDSYRYHNTQEVFDREFVGKTSADVPNFVQYLSQCGEISNRQSILKYGS